MALDACDGQHRIHVVLAPSGPAGEREGKEGDGRQEFFVILWGIDAHLRAFHVLGNIGAAGEGKPGICSPWKTKFFQNL
jgi:hypothetical protein